MADDEPKKSGGLREKLLATVLGCATALSGIVVDTLTTWRDGMERDRAELRHRLERLELLLLGRSQAPGTKDSQ